MVDSSYFEGQLYFELDTKQQLIFAIIKAASESDAREKARSLIIETHQSNH